MRARARAHRGGSGFTDNTVDAIVLFHQENGQWKLWSESEDVLGITVAPLT